MKLAEPFIITDMQDAADFLRGRRLVRRLTQTQLAQMMGVRQSMISEWETGAVGANVTSFIAWANALNYQIAIVGGPSCSACFDDPPSGFRCLSCQRKGGGHAEDPDRG